MTTRDTSWYSNQKPCMYCGFPLGYDPDAQVNAQYFKGGGSVYLMQREPERVAHGNCDFWASDADRAAKLKKPTNPKSIAH